MLVAPRNVLKGTGLLAVLAATSGGFTACNPQCRKVSLKRTNRERGLDVDPKWVEISWEEA